MHQGRSQKEELMDIGKPTRTYTVEPVEDPIPNEQPEKADTPPVEPAPREPGKVPAGTFDLR